MSAIHGVALKDGVLHPREDQALYRDQPAGEGGFRAVAFCAAHRFYVQAGKLHYEYDGESFDVDTESKQRRPSADAIPPFISVEI